MNAFRNFCTVAFLVALAWVWANWSSIKTAWKYRAQIEQAADVGQSLSDLGVLK